MKWNEIKWNIAYLYFCALLPLLSKVTHNAFKIYTSPVYVFYMIQSNCDDEY